MISTTSIPENVDASFRRSHSKCSNKIESTWSSRTTLPVRFNLFLAWSLTDPIKTLNGFSSSTCGKTMNSFFSFPTTTLMTESSISSVRFWYANRRESAEERRRSFMTGEMKQAIYKTVQNRNRVCKTIWTQMNDFRLNAALFMKKPCNRKALLRGMLWLVDIAAMLYVKSSTAHPPA